MSPDLKKVADDLFKNGEKISDIARILQQPRSTISDIIRRFRKAGTVENRPRSGRPPAMDDRDYRQFEKIVKTERRPPLVEITLSLMKKGMSKRTVRRRLRDHEFSRRVCRKKVVTIEKNDWHGVRRKGGGQLSINGVKLYSVTTTSLYWAGQTCICMEKPWRKVETALGKRENGPQIQCHGVGMYLLQRRRNTY